ncbi:PREDICTED: immunoglobulin superfamily member 1-like, partial [Bison bison bison]|uniref:immunoglobulin superfamily member 1-like n=1 Tax=Bison bison bison TaxID=43346 RepID=UPI0005760C4F
MYPKPFFETWTSPVVTPGSRVTFNCSTPQQHMSFILYKDGSEVASSDSSWASLGASAAHFLIISVGIGDGGNYSCRYYDFAIWSEPSDPVELVVTAFVLLKKGIQEPLKQQRPNGYRADFWMPAVSSEDSGMYSCVYYLDSAPLAASNHSDSLEIWVTDKPPKPSLSASPSTVFKLGKDITLQCRGPLPGVEFVLEHDGEEAPQQFSEDGDFVINNVEGKGIGNYSCSYRLQAYPDIWSEPSDTLELVGAAGPAAQECTVGNIVRSTLIVVVVVALGVVLAIEWKKWPRLRTRGSETDGRDQTIALEECNQEGDLGTSTDSPSSVSQGTSVEQPVPI